MKIKLLILGILYAQVLIAQELTMKLSDEQIKNLGIRESLRLLSETNQIYLDDSDEQETIIDTVDVVATLIDWSNSSRHVRQTFLKEVRTGTYEMQRVLKKVKNTDVWQYIWDKVPVFNKMEYYFVMTTGEWVKVADSYDVRNVIYKYENKDK